MINGAGRLKVGLSGEPALCICVYRARKSIFLFAHEGETDLPFFTAYAGISLGFVPDLVSASSSIFIAASDLIVALCVNEYCLGHSVSQMCDYLSPRCRFSVFI